ncbi:MAG: metal ABC transporter substrate-binding protein [Tenericutes bacterium HGW-Tenericutes-1]|nr:MAG: metal ABC transporter substrate-binding protein [Tenericutes bacterium HGW-Tenericutes-1]
MKKLITLVLIFVTAFTLTACTLKEDINDSTIKIGATLVPHAEILEFAKAELLKKGYTLEIVEFTDYVLPNDALANSELDANFFQHVPYLNSYNEAHDTALVSAGSVHFEPLGIYAGTKSSLSEVSTGDSIAVPNDSSNLARALLLLEANGLITLKSGVGVNATVLDIVSNPLNLEIVEIEAAGIASRLDDVEYAVINGNYALSANVTDKLLVSEATNSVAAVTYANIIAVRSGTEESPAIVALLEVLQSDAVSNFITSEYGISVVPVF